MGIHHRPGSHREGKDPDISSGLLAWSPGQVAARTGLGSWLAGRQGWVIFPLQLLEGLALHAHGLRAVFGRHQIEHHLFPSTARPDLRRAQPVVQAFCERHGVRCTQPSLGGAYLQVTQYLNRVGLRRPDVFGRPLVAQHRRT